MATVSYIQPEYQFSLCISVPPIPVIQPTSSQHRKKKSDYVYQDPFPRTMRETFQFQTKLRLSALCKKDIDVIFQDILLIKQYEYTCDVFVENDISGTNLENIIQSFKDAGRDSGIVVTSVETKTIKISEMFHEIQDLKFKCEKLREKIISLQDSVDYLESPDDNGTPPPRESDWW